MHVAGVLVGVAIVGFLGLLAFGFLSEGPEGSAGQVAVANAAPDIPVEVYSGPGLEAGQTVRLSDFRGTPVVLNFWAGLCPPCRAEMPDFQDLQEQFGDQVVILGVDIGPFVGLGSNRDGQDLVQSLGITYITGSTSRDAVSKYEVLGMPTTYFLDADGSIQRKWTGLLTRDQMVANIEEIIQAS